MSSTDISTERTRASETRSGRYRTSTNRILSFSALTAAAILRCIADYRLTVSVPFSELPTEWVRFVALVGAGGSLIALPGTWLFITVWIHGAARLAGAKGNFAHLLDRAAIAFVPIAIAAAGVLLVEPVLIRELMELRVQGGLQELASGLQHNATFSRIRAMNTLAEVVALVWIASATREVYRMSYPEALLYVAAPVAVLSVVTVLLKY